jgi:hypothetical protein
LHEMLGKAIASAQHVPKTILMSLSSKQRPS